jgi:hypothetical protein
MFGSLRRDAALGVIPFTDFFDNGTVRRNPMRKRWIFFSPSLTLFEVARFAFRPEGATT